MVTAPAGMPLARFMDEVFAKRRHSAYPVVADDLRVTDVMIALAEAEAVEAGEPLSDVALALAQNPVGRVPVVANGNGAGLLSITDVTRLLELRRLRDGGRCSKVLGRSVIMPA